MSTHQMYKKKYLRAKTQKTSAIMKAMKSQGIATQIIADKFHVTYMTAAKYLKYELAPKWQEFSEDVRKMYMVQDFDMMQELYKGLKDKMPKATFRDMAEFFKTLRTVDKDTTKPANLSQTNIHFEITDGTKKQEVIKGEEVKK